MTTTKITLLTVLGFIFVAAVVSLVIFFRDAQEGHISFEVAKALLQLGAVAVIGTLVSMLLWEYQAEQTRLDEDRDRDHQAQVRARELARRRHEYRDELLTGTLARVVCAYSKAKKARRLLRARVGVSPGAPGWVALVDYDCYIGMVNEAQLELETLKGDVKTSAVAFSMASDIKEWLKSMERYLGGLIKEYEANRHLVAKEGIPMRFDQLKNLSDFLGKAEEGNGFKKDVIDPYHKIQEAIREDLLHPNLPA